MRLNVDVRIDRSHISRRMDSFLEKLYPTVKQQVKAGSDRYTPYHNGDLMDSADPSAHDSTPYLVYDIKYAKYQFYAGGGAPERDFPNRDRSTHPEASMMWTDCYLRAGGQIDIQRICDNAPRLLRF